MSESKVFAVTVEEVHSGDDVVLLVDLGIDGLFKRVRARLRGVDTPSAFKAKTNTEAGTVREMVRELAARGRCRAVVHAQGKGGWLVTLNVVQKDETVLSINEILMAKGYVYRNQKEQDAT